MSVELGDWDHMSEWTLVNASGDDEDPINEPPPKDSTLEEGASGEAQLGHFQLESKICEISEKDDGVFQKPPSKEGSEASDIERISDDGMECINYPLQGYVISSMTPFSWLGPPANKRDADMESLSGSSGISVIQEDLKREEDLKKEEDLKREEDDVRPTNYTHKPNRKLNFTLNLLLVLSVTMVVGLGIGHFIGFSSRWMHARQIHQAHIANIMALQEELVDCLRNPSSYYLEKNGESKACYEKLDYWKKKFEVMLSENRVLQEFVDRTKHKDEDDDEDDEKSEEANKNIVTEYRQLKFHLIMQQLENVASLRHVEALKHQEIETLYRVKQLEEENEELKAQVQEDSDEDAEKEGKEKAIIMHLTSENQELKQELNKLMTALKLEQEEDERRRQDEKMTTEELWPLRQQINQLQVENSELKQVIAKLRYGQPPTEKEEPKAQPKSRFGNSEPPQKPDNALHSWLVDNMKELNLTNFIEYLTKVAMDKDAARQELMHLEENLKLSYEQLSEKAKHGIDTGKTLLSDLQKNLHAKLEQIMNVDPSDIALPIEHIQKAGKTLKKTVEKMYEIGMDMLNTRQEDGPENGENHKFQKQVDKLMVKFGKQWENIKSSVWGGEMTEDSVDTENVEEEKMHEKPNDDIFVAASREDHEKDNAFLERAENPKKEIKEDKNKQKKTAIKNGEDKQSEERLHPAQKSVKNEKQDKKDKKNKNKEAGKYRKSCNKHASEDKSSDMVKKEKKSKKDMAKIMPENYLDESFLIENEMKSKSHKKSKNNKEKEKFRKHHNKHVHEDKPPKSRMNENSLNSAENHDSSFDEEKRRDCPREFKSKEKRKDKSKETKQQKIREKRSKKQNNDNNTNNTEFSDEHSGDWMFRRAEERTTKRKSLHQSDWLFDRAYDRQNMRHKSPKAEWYFKQSEIGEEDFHGASKKSSHHKEATKSNKKASKMRGNQRQHEYEDSSDEAEEFMWHEKQTEAHSRYHKYNVNWAMTDSGAHYSS